MEIIRLATTVAAFPIRKMRNVFNLPNGKRIRIADFGEDSPASQRKLSESSTRDADDGGVKLEPPSATPTKRESISHQQRVNSSSAVMSEVQDLLVKSSKKPKVFESSEILLPGDYCKTNHGKGKGPPPYPNDCGQYYECDEIYHLLPDSARKLHFHLRTADSVHDLKRWLTTPNHTPEGTTLLREDSIDFVRFGDFTDAHLRSALIFAVEELHYLHDSLAALVEYARRLPYNVGRGQNAIPEARPLGEIPSAEDFASRGARHQLMRWMEILAVEMDYVRECTCDVERKVNEQKWKLAQAGDGFEIGQLLKLEVLSLEQARRYCGVKGG